jgi:hypothetical protein
MWHLHRSRQADRDVRTYSTAAASFSRQALLLVSTGVLLWNSWRCTSRTHRARLDAKAPRRLNEPLQTWEGEGGRPDAVGTSSAPTTTAASTA